jgi:hypothetical protein
MDKVGPEYCICELRKDAEPRLHLGIKVATFACPGCKMTFNVTLPAYVSDAHFTGTRHSCGNKELCQQLSVVRIPCREK